MQKKKKLNETLSSFGVYESELVLAYVSMYVILFLSDYFFISIYLKINGMLMRWLGYLKTLRA
jgi:hypothetical protein